MVDSVSYNRAQEESAKVSVIMPVYNAERYLEEAIHCILNQTHRNLELLIYNDGSADQTNQICSKIEEKDPRIKYFSSEKNRGNLFATNFLFSRCAGDYVAIQDADDLCNINKLELQLQAFHENSNLAMVGTQFLKIDQHGAELFCGLLPRTNAEIKKTMERFIIPVLYASVLVKATVVKQIGGFPEFFNRQGYADLDWLAKCALYGEVINLDQPLYSYREHTESFSNQSRPTFFWTPYFELLLVEAHRQRSQGRVDFFQNSDIKRIRAFLSEWTLQRAWDAFLVLRLAKGFKLVLKGVAMNFFSRKTASNLYYGILGLYRYKRNQTRSLRAF